MRLAQSQLPSEVREVVDGQSHLSTSDQERLLELYATQKKNGFMSTLFLVVLGVFCVHLFYLSRTKEGLFRLFGLHFLGLLVAGIGGMFGNGSVLQIGLVVALVIPLVLGLVDAFRLNAMIRSANVALMKQLASSFSSGAT